jgi:flagellar L-ring protein precursor FlgH
MVLRMSTSRLFAVLTLMLAMAGCSVIPPEPIVKGPTSALPPARPMTPVASSGAIFQPTVYGNYPLFEDARPRNVGDVVTVLLQENTAAAKNVATDTSRTTSVNTAIAAAPAFMSGLVNADLNGSGTGANAMKGAGDSSANNTFRGTLTTTVIGVLPNGNLQVAGEKEIAINRGSEYVRFSGVVDPRSISGTNSVPSTLVADVRLEYRSKGIMDEVQTMGWLQRFFLIASPF